MKNLSLCVAVGLALTCAVRPTSGLSVTLEGPERHSNLVEKVSSSGTQSMNLGLRLSSDMKVTAVFALKRAGDWSRGMFGARTSASDSNFSAGNDSNGFFADFYNYKDTRMGPCLIDTDVKYRVEVSALERILKRVSDDGVVASNCHVCTNRFQTSQNASLFDINGSGWGNRGWYDIYSLSILSGGTLIRDFVPCVVDGKGRLFDRVTGSYPEFIKGESLEAGAEIAGSVPPNVEALDRSATIGLRLNGFEESDGPVDVYSVYAPSAWGVACSNTFVGTTYGFPGGSFSHTGLGYALTQDMEIDMTFSIETEERGEWTHGIFGARNGASSNNIGVLFYGFNSSGMETIHLDFNNSNYADYRLTYNVKYDVNRHKRYRAILSAGRRVLMNADNMIVLAQNTNACPDAITTPEAWLFGMNSSFGGCGHNVYALTVRRGGKAIHDYRPMTVNGVTGMFDCVTKTMVQNAAAADFRAGSAIPIAERSLVGITADGSYRVEIPRRKLTPETEYHFGLFATGGAGKGYAAWGVDYPRTFTTMQRIPTGLLMIYK